MLQIVGKALIAAAMVVVVVAPIICWCRKLGNHPGPDKIKPTDFP